MKEFINQETHNAWDEANKKRYSECIEQLREVDLSEEHLLSLSPEHIIHLNNVMANLQAFVDEYEQYTPGFEKPKRDIGETKPYEEIRRMTFEEIIEYVKTLPADKKEIITDHLEVVKLLKVLGQKMKEFFKTNWKEEFLNEYNNRNTPFGTDDIITQLWKERGGRFTKPNT